ncbi:MAG: cell division protein ZapB [Alkalispirochaeta sp.]
MLSIDQVRLLEERVQRVIARTGELQRENGSLRERLEEYEGRIRELQEQIDRFVSNQADIEQGVLNALHRLDEVEDAVVEGTQEPRTVEHAREEPDHVGEINTADEESLEKAGGDGSSDEEQTAVVSYDSADAEGDDATAEPEAEYGGTAADPDVDESETGDSGDETAQEEEDSGPELDIF